MLVDLNQIAARVGEDRDRDGPGDGRLDREDHAFLLEPLHLAANVRAFERGDGNAVLPEGGLIGARGWMAVRNLAYTGA